ncbi:ABC transporter permease [Loigolactobacillus bifermentans]|uniref:ABC-2 type transporter n=1 Tax=Loigolactobacillus bifermentans DSM 20003 TaxID=1423726 RepID=A0A0R1GXY0_9LACO|nr:ABC transporter permease [Loigolactobacillus bifermentans]KRK39110.1 ABC-2 type transporter [Loigolactobacillus bifermentans DSM 20003]QGG59003.1 ABC transporter permease subunit [Loigolactobacillus bifermentans]
MRAWTISKRVIKELFRDKRTLALMFLAPVLIMFLMKLIFAASTTTEVKVATVDLDGGIRTELNAVKHVAVVKKASVHAAKTALKNQKVDAVIQQTKSQHYRVTYANTDASKTALTKQAFKGALAANGTKQLKATTTKLQQTLVGLQQQVAAKTGSQVTATTTPKKASTGNVMITNHYAYGDKDTGFFDKILPILMGFFVFFFVFLISGMALLKERTSGTLERLLATPVRRSEIVVGYMLSYGILAVIQTIIIVLTTVYLMNVQITGSLLALMVVNFLLALVALAFGILMSTFARSEFQMMQFIPIVVIPQVFFSGIVPLDSLAHWVQNIAYILPLTYAGDAMTQIMMYGTKLSGLGLDIGILLVFLLGLTGLNILGLRRYRKV